MNILNGISSFYRPIKLKFKIIENSELKNQFVVMKFIFKCPLPTFERTQNNVDHKLVKCIAY